jgi:small-conductance mechanosensitive channel
LNSLTDILNWTIFTVGDTATTLRAVLAAITVLFITYFLSKAARNAVSWRVKRLDDHEHSKKISGFVVSLIIWFIGFEVAIHFLGFRLTTLIAASGFLALAAGFAVKNIAENLVSGSILRVEKTIRSGDIIIMDDTWLIVEEVGLRMTRAETYDGEEILIPNATIAGSVVKNLTRQDRCYRLEIEVGVAYESDLKLVRETLEEVVGGLDWRSQSKASAVYLHDFGRWSVIYSINIWIDDLDDAIEHKSDLMEAVWWALKDKDITIEYDHRHKRTHV